MSYALESYSWKDVALWGVCKGHWEKACLATSWKDRCVHVIIATALLFPILSQIGSVFEKVIVENCCFRNSSSHHRAPLTPMSRVNIPPGPITNGHGEYIVFHIGGKQLSQDTFAKVYEVFQDFSIAGIVQRAENAKAAEEEWEARFESTSKRVKEIDDSLAIAFIPRTLYGLFFVQQCIEEDYKLGKVCPRIEDPMPYDDMEETRSQKGMQERWKRPEFPPCWHVGKFWRREGLSEQEKVSARIKDAAYRLNQVIVQTLFPREEGFQYQEIQNFAQGQVDYLQRHCQDFHSTAKRIVETSFNLSSHPGPTIRFGVKSHMGIDNERDAQILINAITLECSKVGDIFLYRGAQFLRDSIYSERERRPYSLSYGSTPLDACVYDNAATPFGCMIGFENDAFAIPLKISQIKENSHPFHLLLSRHPIAQILREGEIHERTLFWKEFNVEDLNGKPRPRDFSSDVPSDLSFLQSQFSKDELVPLFERCMNTAISLRT